MSLSDWHLAVKLADQPLAPKSILRLPETELGEYSLGGYSISFLKQLIAGKLQESVPDPELIGESLWTGNGRLLWSLFGEDTSGITGVNSEVGICCLINVNTLGKWVLGEKKRLLNNKTIGCHFSCVFSHPHFPLLILPLFGSVLASFVHVPENLPPFAPIIHLSCVLFRTTLSQSSLTMTFFNSFWKSKNLGQNREGGAGQGNTLVCGVLSWS